MKPGESGRLPGFFSIFPMEKLEIGSNFTKKYFLNECYSLRQTFIPAK